MAPSNVSTSDARATTRKIRVICGPDPGDSATVRCRRQRRCVTAGTCDEMPCVSRVRAALRAILANSSWRECIGSGAEWLSEVLEQRFSESELMAIGQAVTLPERVVEP